MAMKLSENQRKAVLHRMSEISNEIEDEFDYRRFGAISDLHYEMSDAKLAGLNAEYDKLKKLVNEE